MTTIKAIRLASLVTGINVLVASGFSIAAIIRLQDDLLRQRVDEPRSRVDTTIRAYIESSQSTD